MGASDTDRRLGVSIIIDNAVSNDSGPLSNPFEVLNPGDHFITGDSRENRCGHSSQDPESLHEMHGDRVVKI